MGLQIATGFALLLVLPSRFGTWKAKIWLKNFDLRCPEIHPALDLHNVCLWLGLLMVKPYLLVILITKFEYGKCQLYHPDRLYTLMLYSNTLLLQPLVIFFGACSSLMSLK